MKRIAMCYTCLLLVIMTGLAAADTAFVGCSTNDAAYTFDTETGTHGPLIDLLPEGNYPYDATIRPDGSEVWIPGASGDGVVVIDRASGLITHRITTGDYPVSVAFSGDGGFALVSCRGSDRLDIVDTSSYTVTGNLPITSPYMGPGNIALNPVSGKFYLVDWYGDILFEIAADAGAVLREAPVGHSLWQVVVDPDGETVYVTDRGTDQLRAIELAGLTQTGSVPVGDDPWGLDISEDGATLVVCCEDDNTVQVIDAVTLTATWLNLPTGSSPRDLDILDEVGIAYIAGGNPVGDDPIYLVDLTTADLLDTYTVPGSNINVVAVQAQRAHPVTAVAVVPAALRLTTYPNPFNPKTTLHFALEQTTDLKLTVHDAMGRRLCVLATGTFEAGEHSFTWNGRDGQGRHLSSGLYLARLDAGGITQTTKLLLVQ